MTTKLDIAKNLFEWDKRVAKDLHGLFHSMFKELEWSDLEPQYVVHYHKRVNELIKMVKELE